MKIMSLILVLLCGAAFGEEPVKPPAPPPGWGETETPAKVVSKKKDAEAAPVEKKPATTRPDASKIESQEDLDKYLTALGMTQIGKDPFAYKDVKWGKPVFGNTEVIGQIASWGKDLKVASFTISFLDKDGELLDSVVFIISNLRSGDVKSFKTYTTVDTAKAVKYKIQFENGL